MRAIPSYLRVALIGLLLMVSGCNAYVIRKGDLTVVGASFLDRKGIQRANLEGFGSIEGYSVDPNIDAMRAMAEGMAAGAVKGAK